MTAVTIEKNAALAANTAIRFEYSGWSIPSSSRSALASRLSRACWPQYALIPASARALLAPFQGAIAPENSFIHAGNYWENKFNRRW